VAFTASLRNVLIACAVAVAALVQQRAAAADPIETIRQVKRSVVAVGTFERTRVPAFQFRGTGFAVGNGILIATNAHVLPPLVDAAHAESLAVLLPGPTGEGQVREATRIAIDSNSDLALLRVAGAPLPPLRLRDSDAVREGQDILFTGFPIGPVLGAYAATHRGMVSAITPIAIPQGRASELEPAVVRRLTTGVFPVFQLDATAYPGNSGSPVYDPANGDVLGIVNMVFVKGTKEAVLAQPSGITYAIPAAHLDALIRSAVDPRTAK
jgi:S1-C subfamily serine protease